MDSLRFARFEEMIGSAAKSIARLKAARMARFHLSAAHTSCLLRLFTAPDGLTQTGLREALHMDRAQVSRVLRQLSGKGYACCCGSGYNCIYRLTENGMAVAREIDGIVGEVLSFVSGELPGERIEAFYRTFAIITANLSEAERRFGAPSPQQDDLKTDPKEELS